MLQKKIIWKLNIIDLLLIIIILLSVAALIYKSVSSSNDNDYRVYNISYVCESAPIGLFDTIHTGELCIDGGTGEEVGELSDFETTPIIEYLPYATAQSDDDRDETERDNRRRPTPTPEPTRARAVFTTEVEAAQAEHGIRINRNVYLIGQSMQLVIGNTVFDVYISEMK